MNTIYIYNILELNCCAFGNLMCCLIDFLNSCILQLTRNMGITKFFSTTRRKSFLLLAIVEQTNLQLEFKVLIHILIFSL
jgi:hypothetical protein